MPQPISRAICLIALLALCCTAAQARSRPDQVLVVYNADWTQDLDGSAPGQDSEEIARYYVQRRTDPETGLKPYLLALSSGDPNDLVLNQTVLKETSDDNWLGLDYLGLGHLKPMPWPLTKRGEVVVDIGSIAEARSPEQFVLAMVTQDDFKAASGPGGFSLALTDAEGQQRELLSGGRAAQGVSAMRLPEGLLLAVDVRQIGERRGKLTLSLPRSEPEPIRQERTFELPGAVVLPEAFEKINRPDRTELLKSTGFLPGLWSQAGTIGLLGKGQIVGIRIQKSDAEHLDLGTLRLSVRPLADAGDGSAGTDNAEVLFRDGQPVGDRQVALFRLKSGDVVISAQFDEVAEGPILARLEAADDRQDGQAWSREVAMYEPSGFMPSITGPDGIRDDAVYLRTIEEPIKAFLESTRTADGTLLKDHILYIVVVHGLPLQVRSFYGIERGTQSSMRRGPDHGAGSALTQRIRMLYYNPTQVRWGVTGMLNGGRGGVRLLSLANPLRACMVGPGWNPYMHPLTHQKGRRQKVWNDGGLEAMAELRPTPFSTEHRRTAPEEKFLYAATRIAARDVATAKAQVDGALYGERYLTPQLGPAFYGAYQEAPLAAKVLEAMGFRAEAIPPTADRSLFYFGVFGHGAKYADAVGTGKATECVWGKGFYPGSAGTAIRSWLGWDRTMPPSEVVTLFEQVLRAGATVTCGTAGGSHDTNLSWWDNVIFHWMLLGGYEYGDATLRSMIYLDWTIDMVGDPLYRPDLAQTEPDTTPPAVARAEDISATVRPAGGGTFAVEVRARLANTDPEMVETHVGLWPKGTSSENADAGLRGANTHYSAEPHAVAMGLASETEYELAVELVDPYGNRFDSLEAFGPIAVTTPSTRPVFTATADAPEGRGAWVIELPERQLDDAGELHIVYRAAEGQRETVPTVLGEGDRRLMDQWRGLRIGGARLPISIERKPVMRPGREHHLVIRWRRFPVTREVALVDDATGRESIVTTANNLPWDPAGGPGNRIEVSGRVEITAVRATSDAMAAPPERRGPFVERFDFDAYYEDSE